MKGAIVEEIRLSVVKRKGSQRFWQSCDPGSVTSSSFASSLNMTALPISGPPEGQHWHICLPNWPFHDSPTHRPLPTPSP